jgi:hypothetical protein
MIRKTICTLLAAGMLAPFAASSQETAAAGVNAAGTETGTVVFFREKKIVGSAIRYKVRENGKELCKLKSGTYCTVAVSAGNHEYTVATEAKDLLTLTVEPGKTYYVLGAISMGAFAGHPNLTSTDVATFDGMKAKLKDNTGQDLGGDEK